MLPEKAAERRHDSSRGYANGAGRTMKHLAFALGDKRPWSQRRPSVIMEVLRGGVTRRPEIPPQGACHETRVRPGGVLPAPVLWLRGGRDVEEEKRHPRASVKLLQASSEGGRRNGSKRSIP